MFGSFMLFVGCYGTNTDSTKTLERPFNTEQKSYLYTLFKSEYLWYDKVPDIVSYDLYETPSEMIQALRYAPIDKWSYAQTQEEYENVANQSAEGFGCYYQGAQILFMRIDSPCEKAGLQRGDIVVNINSGTASEGNYTAASQNFGVESIFRIYRNGVYSDVPITPSKYNYKSVKTQILTSSNGVKVGHLIYNSFTSASVEELDTAFTYFKQNSIDELIVDLRYNFGGSLTTASILMDKIAGYNNENSVQMKLQFNSNYSDQDSFYRFEQDENSLDLQRVFFLTTQYSASASETTINALKPYLDVKLIGSKTYGKPVGMMGRSNGDFIYWLINFSVYNVNGEGDFYNGIGVDCEAGDNLNYLRTDENGNMLHEALYYIDNGRCS